MKIYIRGLKQDIALGNLVQQAIKATIDPQGRLDNCPVCKERQRRLNELLTITSAPLQPPAPQPKPLPSDYRQMYHAASEDDLPEGGE